MKGEGPLCGDKACGHPAWIHQAGTGRCRIPACLCQAFTRPTRPKFGAKPARVNGLHFDSHAEAAYYGELVLMEKAGLIADLEHPAIYELHAPGGGTVGRIEVDFRFFDKLQARVRVQDVKGDDRPRRHHARSGTITDLFNWKARHLALEYGVTIEIIRR